jgi:hypothetical protein
LRLHQGERVTITEITDHFIEVQPTETCYPNAAAARVYEELQELQDQASLALRGVFARHRQFLNGRSASV